MCLSLYWKLKVLKAVEEIGVDVTWHELPLCQEICERRGLLMGATQADFITVTHFRDQELRHGHLTIEPTTMRT